MHGIIFWELRDYAEKRHGAGTWLKLLEMAGVTEKVYLGRAYPDEEMSELISSASVLSGKPIPLLLEDFGEYFAPSLLTMYGHLIKPEWRTLDVIEHSERVGHGAVRQESGMAPPFLSVKRLGPEKLVLTYSSPRRLCALAVGIAKGLGKHFEEKIVIRHSVCMHAGAPSCEIVIQTIAAKATQAKARGHEAGR